MNFSLPTAKISNPDVTRLINSDEIQSVVRPAGQKVQKRPWTQKKNPLVNKAILFRLNPYAKTLRRQELRMSFPLYPELLDAYTSYSQAGAHQGEGPQEGEEEVGRQGLPRQPPRALSASSDLSCLSMLHAHCMLPCFIWHMLDASDASCHRTLHGFVSEYWLSVRETLRVIRHARQVQNELYG